MWNPSKCSRLLASLVPAFLAALTVGASLPAQAQLPSGPPVPGGRLAAPPAGWQSLSIEPSTDRLGADYRIFDLQVADVEPCRRACADDPRCAAYTYADPGLVSPQPRCFLKKSAPEPQPKAGCTSGQKPPVARTLSIEPSTDRLGADYRIFDLAAPNVEPCRRACADDPRCAAYTYADPGLVSPQPRCFLKKAAPPARPKAGCTSGARSGPPITPRPPLPIGTF